MIPIARVTDRLFVDLPRAREIAGVLVDPPDPSERLERPVFVAELLEQPDALFEARRLRLHDRMMPDR